jgi:hypothetical protein
MALFLYSRATAGDWDREGISYESFHLLYKSPFEAASMRSTAIKVGFPPTLSDLMNLIGGVGANRYLFH